MQKPTQQTKYIQKKLTAWSQSKSGFTFNSRFSNVMQSIYRIWNQIVNLWKPLRRWLLSVIYGTSKQNWRWIISTKTTSIRHRALIASLQQLQCDASICVDAYLVFQRQMNA